MGFAAMLADEQILLFLFAIGSGSSRRNSIGFLFLSSSAVILLGFGYGLDIIKYQHSSKPLTLAAMLIQYFA
jgi:hypothetical protein